MEKSEKKGAANKSAQGTASSKKGQDRAAEVHKRNALRKAAKEAAESAKAAAESAKEAAEAAAEAAEELSSMDGTEEAAEELEPGEEGA